MFSFFGEHDDHQNSTWYQNWAARAFILTGPMFTSHRAWRTASPGLRCWSKDTTSVVKALISTLSKYQTQFKIHCWVQYSSPHQICQHKSGFINVWFLPSLLSFQTSKALLAPLGCHLTMPRHWQSRATKMAQEMPPKKPNLGWSVPPFSPKQPLFFSDFCVAVVCWEKLPLKSEVFFFFFLERYCMCHSGFNQLL